MLERDIRKEVFKCAGAQRIDVRKGETVFKSGEIATAAILIDHGIVTEGRCGRLYYVNQPGDGVDFVGAVQKRHSTDVITVTPAYLYVAKIDKLSKVPEWRNVLEADRAEKNRRSEAYMHAVQSGTLPRVANTIIEFFGDTVDEHYIPIDVLANRAGLTRETCNNKIVYLKEIEVIKREPHQRTIEIVDKERLTQIARGKKLVI